LDGEVGDEEVIDPISPFARLRDIERGLIIFLSKRLTSNILDQQPTAPNLSFEWTICLSSVAEWHGLYKNLTRD
jgi:hypothetical protein